MKLTIEMTKAEALAMLQEALSDRMPDGMVVTDCNFDRYGTVVTFEATDNPPKPAPTGGEQE